MILLEVINVIFASMVIHIKQSLVRKTYTFIIFLQPILYSVLFYMIFKNNTEINIAEYIIIGTGIISLWSSIIFSSAGDIERERYIGTLEIIMSAPTKFIVIFTGKVLGNVILGVLSMIISLVTVRYLFKLKVVIENPIEFIIVFTLTIIGFSIMALLLAAIFTLSRNSRLLMNILEYPIYILCGVIFPISILPTWLTYISKCLIPTWSVSLLRESLVGIPNKNHFYEQIGIFIIIIAIYAVISLSLFNKIILKTKNSSDLGAY